MVLATISTQRTRTSCRHCFGAFTRRLRPGRDEVVIWGTGTPRREFLHVDDMAAASLFVMNLPNEVYQANTEPMLSHINVGYGEDVSIGELAEIVAKVTGFNGRIAFDTSKPDGTKRKLMDVSRLAKMGWEARFPSRRGSVRPMIGFSLMRLVYVRLKKPASQHSTRSLQAQTLCSASSK